MASNVKVTLDCIRVSDGQGVGEGNFEMRVQILESLFGAGFLSKTIWPSLNGTTSVNNNGTTLTINREVDTYSVNSVLWKTFLIIATEEDTGTLGQDEVGQASLAFDLREGMSKYSKNAVINLNNRGRNEGQVVITMSAMAV